MRKSIYALVFCAIFGFSSVASAEPKTLGLYLGGHIGASVQSIHNRDVDSKSSAMNFSWRADEKNHGVFSGGIVGGYDFAPELNVPVRVEIDYTLRTRSKSESSTSYTNAGNSYKINRTDKVNLQTLMVNAWVDIPTGTDFTPYIGGGLGAGFIDFKGSGNVEDAATPGNSYDFSGSRDKTSFAWSLGAGLGFALTENVDLDLGYRYINAGEASFTTRSANVGADTKFKVRPEVHDFQFGARYTF